MQRMMILTNRTMDAVGPLGPFDMAPLLEALRDQNVEDEAIFEALIAFHDRQGQIGFPLQLPQELGYFPKDKRDHLLARYQRRQRGKAITAPPPTDTGGPAPLTAGGSGQAASGGTRPIFFILAVVALLVAGGAYGLRVKSAPEPAVAVVIDDSNALDCAVLLGNGNNLLCRMTAAERGSMSKAEFSKSGQATMTAARSLGYKRLIVLQTDGGKLLGSF